MPALRAAVLLTSTPGAPGVLDISDLLLLTRDFLK